jgi:hypothetical protein
MIDVRSPLAISIINANPNAYSSLVVEGGTPTMARDLLEGVKPEQLIVGSASSLVAPNAMLAGLWLWHDGLEESHRISQSMHDATGSFWHAIMHRREGDFSNSKYWYAKTSGHPLYETLAREAGDAINHLPADKRLLRIVAIGWNANALVDLVESVHENPKDPAYKAAVELQRLEWKVLFRFCARGA